MSGQGFARQGRQGQAQLGRAWSSVAGFGRLGVFLFSTARHGTAWLGKARQAEQGRVLLGMVGRCPGKAGEARHSEFLSGKSVLCFVGQGRRG
jgi:hypothetical protein